MLLSRYYPVRLASILALALAFGVSSDGRDDRSGVVVRAQKSPGKAWVEYPARTIDHLPGFDRSETDTQFTPYGGLRTRKGTATGFFHTERLQDRWWMIDPSGCLYYNKAVVSVTIGKSATSRRYVDSVFGTEQAWADSTARLLQSCGFNGTGAWSAGPIMLDATPRLPYTRIWNFMSGYGKERGGTYQQPGHTGYPDDCIFVFDDAFAAYCDRMAAQLADSRNDPFLLGHFSDNELPFPEDALDRYLRLDAKDEGYVAAGEWMVSRKGSGWKSTDIEPGDREEFLEYMADRYFRITSGAIRKYDPNHMYLGSRFHGGILKRRPVFVAAGKYVDVVSINYYNAWTPSRERMEEWSAWSGKPILITEWYVKGADAGLPNSSGAGWIVPTQNDRGIFYQNFALALLELKTCVGWQWFKYIDNDPQAEGVDPSNNDSNKGIVSIRFEPYLPLLRNMTDLNRRVYRLIEYFDGQQKHE